MLIIRRSKLHYTASGIITHIGGRLVHLSIFISVFNQLDAQNLFYNMFYFMGLHVSSTCSHHQEVKISLHSLWYHHTETIEWFKITKIQFYKYEQIVVKFMCEFFRCDYCLLLSITG